MANRRKVSLKEAFKISITVDDDGSVSQGPPQVGPIEGGNFGRYVKELASNSHALSELSVTAEALSRLVENTLDDLSLREDKREFNAGVTKANEGVLRSWRAFLRELANFEGRFR